MLKRYNLYLDSEKIELLEQINGISVSEHIRRSLDSYIKEITLKVSTSPSYDGKKAQRREEE